MNGKLNNNRKRNEKKKPKETFQFLCSRFVAFCAARFFFSFPSFLSHFTLFQFADAFHSIRSIRTATHRENYNILCLPAYFKYIFVISRPKESVANSERQERKKERESKRRRKKTSSSSSSFTKTMEEEPAIMKIKLFFLSSCRFKNMRAR